MKLEQILDQLNSFEKNSFLKILTNLIEDSPKKSKEIDLILSDEKDLKNADNINISKVFSLIENEFTKYIKKALTEATSQFDILIDILIRDGNCIMSREWFNSLYQKEIKSINKKVKSFSNELKNEKSEITDKRKRDYKIYKDCLNTAYFNDEFQNRECKITSEEQSILTTLSKGLGLSQEEIKLINYLIIDLSPLEIDTVINELKNLGIIFYIKKSLYIYIADEIVRILRKVRGKEIADKYYRRVLKQIREPQINLVCKNHNINWKDPIQDKVASIIKEGISFSSVLSDDLYKDDTKLNEKKNFINDLVEKNLSLNQLKGGTLEEKIDNLIQYFDQIDKDDKVGISIGGYDKLLSNLKEVLPKLIDNVRNEFEFQESEFLNSSFLLDYNIKPRDILDILSNEELKLFCEKFSIKTRGNIILNILDAYKDSENLYIENYPNIAYRNLKELKENGLEIKEADLGLKFEEVTKTIFSKLGFIVNDELKKKMNTSKDKIDILIDLNDEGLIIVECKTSKESGFNKFSAVSKQIKSYISLAQSKGYRVVKTLLVAPEFSEDFEKECREEIEMNLSLITADTLVAILDGFKQSKHKIFPYQLLMKDVLIKEDWILKAINK